MIIDRKGADYLTPQKLVRSPQGLLSGLVLVLLALLALWLTRDLSQGTLTEMGPAMLPRWLAVAVGVFGLVLIALALSRVGNALGRWSLRGPVFVTVAIIVFAATIRPLSVGAITTPGFGLLVAGPLAIFISGLASHEARWRELLVLSLGLTALCMELFGDMLNLSIPLFHPQWAGMFPHDWSQKAVLRITAAILAGAAVLLILSARMHLPSQVDVAEPNGRI